MWRIARTVIVFLLLGAVANVAVAWGVRFVTSALGSTPTRNVSITGWSSMTQSGVGANMTLTIDFDVIELISTPFDRLVLRRRAEGEPARSAPPLPAPSAQPAPAGPVRPVLRVAHACEGEYVAGWPMPALRCVAHCPAGSTTFAVGEDVTLKGGVMLPEPMSSWRGNLALPMMPMWPGAMVNSLLYAAVLWLLLGLPFAWRRAQRVRRRRCPACAYPFGSSATCTECGRDVSRWVAADVRSAPSPGAG